MNKTMSPRYQQQRKVRYNSNKGFHEDDTPLIVNKDFHNQYKRNMGLTNKAYRTNTDPKLISHPEDLHKLNEMRFEKAYNAPNYIYKDNDTLYIGGTKTARDAYDDIKIPFGLTRYSKRYMDTDKVLQENQNIHNLTGHSLGGSVALELQKNHPERDYKTTTYGAPVASITGVDNRFRKYWDSVSTLDWGAQSVIKFDPFNTPHSYTGYTSIIK
jgi:hypothetical protein